MQTVRYWQPFLGVWDCPSNRYLFRTFHRDRRILYYFKTRHVLIFHRWSRLLYNRGPHHLHSGDPYKSRSSRIMASSYQNGLVEEERRYSGFTYGKRGLSTCPCPTVTLANATCFYTTVLNKLDVYQAPLNFFNSIMELTMGNFHGNR